MAAIASLPPDQRAVLQLILRRRRSYAQLGETLKIPAATVRERALAAAETIAPPPDEVTDPEIESVVDFLLGQQEADLSRLSAPGRAWGAALARELEEVAPAGVPELPEAEPSGPRRRDRRGADAASTAASPTALPRRDEDHDGGPADVDAAPPSADASPGPEADAGAGSSRLGGALLLA